MASGSAAVDVGFGVIMLTFEIFIYLFICLLASGRAVVAVCFGVFFEIFFIFLQ